MTSIRMDDFEFGNFKFIKDTEFRQSLEEDFEKLNSITDAWYYLKENDKNLMHVDLSTKGFDIITQSNLKNFEFIAKEGWELFVFMFM